MGIDPDSGAGHAAARLAPETFMSALHDGGTALTEWLTATLSQGEPNAAHHVLATAVREGHTVWTVNVDELIEQAGSFGGSTVSAWNDRVPSDSALLLKPHGTVSTAEYVFRSDQVVRPLQPAWAARLRNDCDGAHVVVFGYAGADVDLRLSLADALGHAASVRWFAVPEEQPPLRERFPALTTPAVEFLGGKDWRTLTPSFLTWADDAGLTSEVTSELREASRTQDDKPIPDIGGDLDFARALLLERAGFRADARRAYIEIGQAGLRTPSIRTNLQTWRHHGIPADLRSLTRRVATIDAYDRRWWTRPLFAVAASPAAPILPASLRAHLDRADVTWLGSHQGDHVAAERRMRRVLNPDDDALILARAKAARFTGRFADAVEHSETAVAVSRQRIEDTDREPDSSDRDVLAHGLFELAFALTWAGDLGRARTVIGELREGVDGLASGRWVAWAAWLRATHLLYANRAKSAIDELNVSAQLFVSDALPSGQAAAATVMCTASRMLDDEPAFTEAMAHAESFAGDPGWTAYTENSLDLERAEWARAHGREDRARVFYEKVVAEAGRETVHLSYALLGLAELDRAQGRDSTAVCNRVRDILAEHPMAYIEAHLAIAEALAGRLDPGAAVDRVTTCAPDLATATGKSATRPVDYCLGQRPDLHQLFLP